MKSNVDVRLVLLTTAILIAASACGKKADNEPIVATPSLSVNHARAAQGSPIEITYRFQVANDAAPFARPYRVMVHVLDADGELMWTDDHDPQTPTTAWKPGQTVEYTRTIFVPMYPYIGDATFQVGLYANDGVRLRLAGTDTGQHAYSVGKIQILPQTENVFLIFKEGWHPAEVAQNNSSVEWQWSKKEGTIAFRNPRKDSVFYLHLDNPGNVFKETQSVSVMVGDKPVDQFTLGPRQELIRRVQLSKDQLGEADMVDMMVLVDKTFVPALLQPATSRDPRELGVRVFHAFIEPN